LLKLGAAGFFQACQSARPGNSQREMNPFAPWDSAHYSSEAGSLWWKF